MSGCSQSNGEIRRISNPKFSLIQESTETQDKLTTVQPFSKDEMQAEQQDPLTGKIFDCRMRNIKPAAHKLIR